MRGKQFTERLRTLTVPYPTPEEIKAARLEAGFTKDEAARAVYVFTKRWIEWELPVGNKDHRPCHPAYAELFAYKAGLKELPEIVKKTRKKWMR